MNTRQHFTIQDMTCANFACHVKKGLQNLSDISKIEVGLVKHEAQVEHDLAVLTFESMAPVLKETAYDVLV